MEQEVRDRPPTVTPFQKKQEFACGITVTHLFVGQEMRVRLPSGNPFRRETMSRTIKRAPYGICMRCPRGRKKAIIENARSKAVPPDAWDDIKCSSDTETAYRIASRMIRKGENPDKTAHHISKYTNTFRQAQEIVASVILRERFRKGL